MMPTCCANLKWRDGRRPRATAVSNEDGKWSAFVGSALLSGFDTREDLMACVRLEQSDQRVFKCGHVIRRAALEGR